MAVVIVGVIGIMAVGCSSKSTGEVKDKLTEIKESGKLVEIGRTEFVHRCWENRG